MLNRQWTNEASRCAIDLARQHGADMGDSALVGSFVAQEACFIHFVPETRRRLVETGVGSDDRPDWPISRVHWR